MLVLLFYFIIKEKKHTISIHADTNLCTSDVVRNLKKCVRKHVHVFLYFRISSVFIRLALKEHIISGDSHIGAIRLDLKDI